MVLLVHPDCEDQFPAFSLMIHNFMPMNPAPCGYVVECTRVGAGNFEAVAIRELCDPILGPNHGKRAQ